jgi:cysteine-rich repeat protein
MRPGRLVIGAFVVFGVALMWTPRVQGTNGLLWMVDNTAPDPFERLGAAVSAGNPVTPARVIMGMPGYVQNGVPVGAVLVRRADTGGDFMTIVNPDPNAGDEFGAAVAWRAPDYIMVGAPGDDTNGQDAGAIYILNGNGGGIVHVFRGVVAGDRLGTSVAFAPDGEGNINTLGGAPGADTPGAVDAGKVYLFSNTLGTLLVTCTNPSPTAGDQFGTSVAILGTNFLVGAPLADRGAVDTGAAYLMSGATSGSCPVLTQFAKPGPIHAGDQFGQSVTAVGSNVLIGAPFGQQGPTGPGGAYLFDGGGALVSQVAAPRPAAIDGFGWSVAAAGSNFIVGAPYDSAAVSESGVAYLFDGPSGIVLETVPNPRPGVSNRFGRAVTYAHGDLLIGSPGYASVASFQGAAYLVGVSCSDGVLGAGEGCDDGNMIDGDCCSSACQTEPPGPCDDQNLCTVGDTCVNGACVGSCAGGTQCLGPCGENYVCQVAGGSCVCGAPPPPTSTTTTTTSTSTTTTLASVHLTTPTTGALLTDYTVLVQGTVQGPANAEMAVTVNGTAAASAGGQFAAEIGLSDGPLAITAVARDASGNVLGQDTVSVTVQLPSTEPILVFEPSPAIGTAPLSVTFVASSSVPTVSVVLDADGDGVPDLESTTTDDLTFTYQSPGVYIASLTVTDTANVTHQATRVVQVLSASALDALLQAKWTGLKDALRTGDVAGACEYIALDKRERYATMFDALTIPLADIDQILTNIVFVKQEGVHIEYTMDVPEGADTVSSIVLFVLDEDGIWRLRFL